MFSTLILLVCTAGYDAAGQCKGPEQQWLRKQWEGPTARTACELAAMDANQKMAKANERYICDHGNAGQLSLQRVTFVF